METIPYNESEMIDVADRVARVIEEGGIVCFPCNGAYRLAVDFTDEDAVMTMLQSKRKVKRAPALVFVRDEEQAEEIVEMGNGLGRDLAQSFWPGSLTIMFEPKALSKKLTKQITTKAGKVGLRIPHDTLTQQILARCKCPLLISSANREKKGGESSPAQVKKNFGANVALFVDQGDLAGAQKSTVIDPADGDFSVTREGLVTEEEIRESIV